MYDMSVATYEHFYGILRYVREHHLVHKHEHIYIIQSGRFDAADPQIPGRVLNQEPRRPQIFIYLHNGSPIYLLYLVIYIPAKSKIVGFDLMILFRFFF